MVRAGVASGEDEKLVGWSMFGKGLRCETFLLDLKNATLLLMEMSSLNSSSNC